MSVCSKYLRLFFISIDLTCDVHQSSEGCFKGFLSWVEVVFHSILIHEGVDELHILVLLVRLCEGREKECVMGCQDIMVQVHV